MEADFLWAILGLTLVIVELLTGTFYLLVLGIAAFGAALVAWLGQPFGVQALVLAAISGFGCYGVHLYRAKNTAPPMTAARHAELMRKRIAQRRMLEEARELKRASSIFEKT